MSFISYFLDPIYRGPVWGSILIGMAAAMIGVVVVLRKQSLVGETLSHAAYPGIVIGAALFGYFHNDSLGAQGGEAILLIGAGFSCLIALILMKIVEGPLKISKDASLCFVLSYSFGWGVLLASQIQFSLPNAFRQTQTYFFGQAATLGDRHIIIYGLWLFFLSLGFFVFKRPLKLWLFDPHYARLQGVSLKLMDRLTLVILIFSVVAGVRSVGVVLMSAMLMAPAIAARQCASKLSNVFVLALLFSGASAALGTYLATEISLSSSVSDSGPHLILPTGPLIVLSATFFCLIALLFSPEKGLIMRAFRIFRFQGRCLEENILKALFKFGELPACQIKERVHVSSLRLKGALRQLQKKRWIKQIASGCVLTDSGYVRANKVVRLHRLWELYLADYVGIGASRVHANAEEMEHILTPEIEAHLTKLLHDPKLDPHDQPIPPQVQDT